jgi:UDP-N-acetylmuramoyl-L-alanyl-D-glutamate--2,6-diaminopimelate ligase
MALARLDSPEAAVRWLRGTTTGTLRTDSRDVQRGDAFVAWPGYATDGRRFVADALRAGAAACLVEADGAEAFGFDDARIATLPALKPATGWIADSWFGEPSRHIAVVATTGTNGKTSTAWWVAQALESIGRRAGVIGTLGIGEPPPGRAPGAAGAAAAAGQARIEFTGLTTPDPVRVHGALARMADAGLVACAIEASSIGIVEHRLAGVRIAVALFTNFTRDHLDYHGTMPAYWDAKRRLFAWPGLRAAVVNLDDARGLELRDALQGTACELWTYARHAPARLGARAVRYIEEGLAFELVEGARTAPVRTRLIGDYNVSNLLAVAGALRALGLPLADAAAACAVLTPVPGRMQRVDAPHGPEVVVDYAHTPDALDKALAALQPLARARGGRLWCVFGCGGNRDATKRAPMAAVAQARADRVVLTSDNPRDEDPRAILAQIEAGLRGRDGVDTVEDRRAAIVHALGAADARDVVLLAGKGHEDYQEVRGVKRPFSDVAEAQRALAQRPATTGQARA